MSLITGSFQAAKQGNDGNASPGFVAYAIDANGNPYVCDEAGNQWLLSRPAPAQAELDPAAAVDVALFAATWFSTHAFRIVAGVGSGAYTAKYSLPTANMQPGAIIEGTVDFPASVNPTVNFYNVNSAGTELFSRTGSGALESWYFRFRYDGAQWRLPFRALNA